MRISDWSSDVCSSDLRGGDDDAVEGRLLAPALPAVAVARGDVVQAELQEARLGSLQQLLEALDGVDAPADARQHRCLVARPGADLQHLGAPADRKSTRLNSSH